MSILIVSKSMSYNWNKIWHYFFYFTERNDETLQRLIYNDLMQRLIPRQSRVLARMQGSRIQGSSIWFNVNIRYKILHDAVKTNSNYIRHFLLLECPGNCETCRSGPCSRWCSSANWCGDSDEHKTTDCRMCRFGSMRQNQINLSIE